jgi:hypothetical protein
MARYIVVMRIVASLLSSLIITAPHWLIASAVTLHFWGLPTIKPK